MLSIRKKVATCCIIIVLIMSLSGCGTNTSMVDEIAEERDSTSVQSTSETESELQKIGVMSETNEDKVAFKEVEIEIEEAKEVGTENVIAKDDSNIDVDLTELSSTMVYSEVYNMMSNPSEYLGKTIRIGGSYYMTYWEETGMYYHNVIISDATACCQSGIEFIWDDNSHVYPEEYPKDNTEIEVVGIFSSYEELGETYYYLDTDGITIK